MGTLLTQPWQIELFHVRSLWHMLRLEVNTGMKHSRNGSPLRAANAVLMRNGVIDKPYRRKAAALERLGEYTLALESVAVYELKGPVR